MRGHDEHPLRDFGAALVNAFVMRPLVAPAVGWPKRFHPLRWWKR